MGEREAAEEEEPVWLDALREDLRAYEHEVREPQVSWLRRWLGRWLR